MRRADEKRSVSLPRETRRRRNNDALICDTAGLAYSRRRRSARSAAPAAPSAKSETVAGSGIGLLRGLLTKERSATKKTTLLRGYLKLLLPTFSF